MSNEITRVGASTLTFTSEQRAILLDAFANGASETEFAALLEVAQRRSLDPFKREIFFVQRWDAQKNRMVWATQVSIDGLRLVAERSGVYAGQDAPEFVENPDGSLKACRVAVWRKDWTRPAVGVAYWDEYVQTTRDKQTGKTRPNAMWGKMPRTMLAKCAEALAIRKAFPESAAGLYTHEEMAQADNEAPQAARIVDVRVERPRLDASTATNVVAEPAEARSARAYSTFVDDLEHAENVRAMRIAYLMLVEGLRADGVSAEEMGDVLKSATDVLTGTLREHGLHLIAAEITALLATDGEALARGLDTLRVIVGQGLVVTARWWVNTRGDLTKPHGEICYRAAQRSLADDPRNAASVKAAGVRLKDTIAHLDEPPPTGTDSPAKPSSATATGDAAPAEPSTAPAALAAVPAWASDVDSIRAHVAGYSHAAAVIAGARKWGFLLGPRYLAACADRLAALDPTMADFARAAVDRAAVEGPKAKARKAA